MHFSETLQLTQARDNPLVERVLPPKPEPPKRPRAYADEVGYLILERIANGEKLHEVCADPAMPATCTFFRWVAENKDFAVSYGYALRARFDRQEYDLIQIADDAANDYIIQADDDGIPSVKPNAELLERVRIKLEIRKWIMQKGLPRRYGDTAKAPPAPVDAGELQTITAAKAEEQPRYLAREAIALIRAQKMTP